MTDGDIVTALPETSIEEVATEVTYFERSETWVSNMNLDLGQGFSRQDYANLFGPRAATATVRNFRLRDVHLDAAAMTLIKDGRRISETFYLVKPEYYANARVVEHDLIELDRSVDHVMARAFDNYYNWLVQTVPSIDWTLRGRSISNIVLLSGHLTAWQQELLALLGHDRVPRITLDPNHDYFIPRLEYSEFLNGSTAFTICRSARSTFGRLVDAAANAEPTGADIIYVARTDTSTRVAENEDEVIALLKSEGVHVVVPGDLSVSDQINLFHKASAIIGPHGAGLTNVVFCKPGTILYELVPQHYLNPCINALAQTGGLDYIADIFEGRPDGNDRAHGGRWILDPQLILRRVREIKDRLATARPRAAFDLSGAIGGLFDPDWYLARYPDVASADVDPIRHYIEFGIGEERDPNRFFDNAWYKTHYPDVAESGMNPLLHYLQFGAAERRNPHPNFDAAFYVDQHPEAAGNPLLYHIQFGAAHGWPTEQPRATATYSNLALTLMTYWGTIVFLDEATGRLRHGPVDRAPRNVLFEDRGDCVVPWHVTADGLRVLDFVELGLKVAKLMCRGLPDDADGVVLTDGNEFVCADAAVRITLAPDARPEWRRFMLLRPDDVAVLSELLSNRWIVSNGVAARLLSPGQVGIRPGFVLDIGGEKVLITGRLSRFIGEAATTPEGALILHRCVFVKPDRSSITILRYRPLLYWCVFADRDILDCLVTSITSAVEFGGYQGDMLVVADREEGAIRVLFSQDVNRRLKIVQRTTANTSAFAHERHFIDAFGTEAYQPVCYLDVNVVTNTDLTPFLLDVPGSDAVWITDEVNGDPGYTADGAFSIGPVGDWYGRWLFQQETDLGRRAVGFCRSGVFAFANVGQIRPLFALMRLRDDEDAAAHWLDMQSFADQPLLNYALCSAGLMRIASMEPYLALGGHSASDITERRGFLHFPDGAGAPEGKVVAMRDYLKALRATREPVRGTRIVG